MPGPEATLGAALRWHQEPGRTGPPGQGAGVPGAEARRGLSPHSEARPTAGVVPPWPSAHPELAGGPDPDEGSEVA